MGEAIVVPRQEDPMDLRHAVLGAPILIVFGLTIGLSGQANDAWIGSWKVNVAKSTYSPGPAPKSGTSRFEKLPDGSTKVTLDGTDAQGRHTHSEAVTRMDGKEIPIQPIQPTTTT